MGSEVAEKVLQSVCVGECKCDGESMFIVEPVNKSQAERG